MNVTVAVNPAAGRGRAERMLPELHAALLQRGLDPSIIVTADAGDLRRVVAAARDRGDGMVGVAGGDGTLHGAVQELAGSTTALAIIPTGTGDDNARTLGIPLGNLGAAADVMAAGRCQAIDLGVVHCAGRSEYFLGVLSTGFDSFVNERANAMTWPTGKARYLAAIVAELGTFRPAAYRVQLDDRQVAGSAMLVAVGNGVGYGGGMRICPSADPTDGELDITWIGAVSTTTFLRVFPSVFKGTHVNSPFVSTGRAKRLTLEADGQLAYADGERVGPLPISVDVSAAALRVMLPPPTP